MKQKAYRFENEDELQALIEKFGENYFNYVPKDQKQGGFLFQNVKNGHCGWTSATIKEFKEEPTYQNLEMVSFTEAIIYLKSSLEEEILYAQTLIGCENLIFDTRNLYWKPIFSAILSAESAKTQAVKNYLTETGKEFCVALIGPDYQQVPATLVSKANIVTLAPKVTAEIVNGMINIGTYSFPISALEKLQNACRKPQ